MNIRWAFIHKVSTTSWSRLLLGWQISSPLSLGYIGLATLCCSYLLAVVSSCSPVSHGAKWSYSLPAQKPQMTGVVTWTMDTTPDWYWTQPLKPRGLQYRGDLQQLWPGLWHGGWQHNAGLDKRGMKWQRREEQLSINSGQKKCIF